MKQHPQLERLASCMSGGEESKHIIIKDGLMEQRARSGGRRRTDRSGGHARAHTVAHRRAMGDWQAGRKQRDGGAGGGGGALGHGGEVVGRHGGEY